MAEKLLIGSKRRGSSQQQMRTAGVWVFLLYFPVVLGACRQGPSPTPSPTITVEHQAADPTSTIDPQRMPGPEMTTSVVMPDRSLWYAFDQFDAIGGVSPYSINQGLYNLKDDSVTHYEIRAPIRVLDKGPNSDLYVGAGCGVMRYKEESWETLLELECVRQEIISCLIPLDIAFDGNGTLWVGGPYCLAAFDGESWTEFDVPAARVLAAPDGTIWARGWDGKQGSSCCISRISGGQWTTYTLSADIPAHPELVNELMRDPD